VTAVAKQRRMYLGQDAEIESQGASIDGCIVFVLIIGLAEENILLEGQVLDPGVLGDVCNLASDRALTVQLNRTKIGG
jgi:hypothetical protein